jgi:hypothetical protein
MRRLLLALYLMALPATADVLQQFVARDGLTGPVYPAHTEPRGGRARSELR